MSIVRIESKCGCEMFSYDVDNILSTAAVFQFNVTALTVGSRHPV